MATRPPPKNITPARGAATRAETRRSNIGAPILRGAGPTKRANTARGNDEMRPEDVALPRPSGAPSRGAVNGVSAPSPGRGNAYEESEDPTPRGQGRGNEEVDADDRRRVAEQATNRWDKVDNAIEYLRRYVEHLELQARNKDALDPMQGVRLMDTVKTFKERVSEIVKSPAEKIYDILRFTVVPELFSDNELSVLKIDGIGRCNIMDDITVGMVGDTKEEQTVSREKFYKWLIANELEDMITQTVNAQTLAAFVRRQLKSRDGLKLPMDLLEIKPVTRAQITAG